VTFSTEKRDGETRKIVGCKWRVDPFTPEMADDLSIRDRLFNVHDEPVDDVVAITLAIHEGLQRLTLRMAPDQTRPSLEIPDVQVDGTIKVVRDKENPIYSATFRTFFDYPEASTLLVLCHGVNELHYATFQDEQLDLPTAEDA